MTKRKEKKEDIISDRLISLNTDRDAAYPDSAAVGTGSALCPLIQDIYFLGK